MAVSLNALSALPLTPSIVSAVETAAAAIARLDARFSVSSVAAPWSRRAAWTGYTRALQLQGAEIDEIDVLSWACDLPIAGRRPRISATDEFDAFAAWWSRLSSRSTSNWRDHFPLTPATDPALDGWPAILRAIETCRQATRHDRSVEAWLWLPELLKGVGLATAPLPCLVEGTKAFRLRATPTPDEWRAVARAVAKAAAQGLERLESMEGHHRHAIAALAGERRPGALTRLLALATVSPLLSPQAVSTILKLSLPGAGKLLARARDLGLLVEVSGRRVWKRYLVPDLAVTFGYVPAPRGRPTSLPATSPLDRDLAATLRAFDAEMHAFDLRFGMRPEDPVVP